MPEHCRINKMNSSGNDKVKLKMPADGSMSVHPVKKRIAAFLGLISICLMLTGCGFGFVEGVSGIPIIGSPLASMMVNVATMPADPTHSLLDVVMDSSYIDNGISKSLLLGNGATLADTEDTNVIQNLWKYVQAVYDKLSGVGIALCTTFFVISIIGMASKENTTLEHYIKELVKLMIAIAILSNLILIINSLMAIGDTALMTVRDEKYDSKVPYSASNDHRWELLMGNQDVWSGISFGGDNDDTMYINGSPAGEVNDTIQSFLDYSLNSSVVTLSNALRSSGRLKGSSLDTLTSNPFAPGGGFADSAGSGFLNESWNSPGSSEWPAVYKKLCTIAICMKASQKAEDSISGYGMLGAMGNWYSCFAFVLILAFASLVAKIAAYFAAYQRLLEIAWRVIFAPIGCSNMFDGAGANTPGVRYLKALFGVCLSGVLLIVILKLGTGLANDILIECCSSYNGSLLIAAIAVKLATIGAAMGVSGKVKEVMS